MRTSKQRKVDNLVMLAVPPAFLDQLHLRVGEQVGLAVDRGRLIVTPGQRPRYSLDNLLGECDPQGETTMEEHEWLGAVPVGGEMM